MKMKILFWFSECELPTSPDNGSLAVSNNGYTVTYSCNVGYSLNGDVTRTCQGSGQSWNGSPPSCGLTFFFLQTTLFFKLSIEITVRMWCQNV